VKRQVAMPKAPASKERGFELVSGDSIAFLNLSGNPARHELLVKDRYEHFWVYNNKLELLWQGEEQTGHYPYPFPATQGGNRQDGRDEVAIGYSIWTAEGKRLWSQGSVLKDHADGVMVGNLSGDPKAEPRMYASGSDEGFLMFDLDGKLLKQVRVGHNQSPAVGKFRPIFPAWSTSR
jgi:rhamnogalacturonan endolyase